jgi:O-antigen ligase
MTLVFLQRRKSLAIVFALVVAVPVSAFIASQEGYLDRLQTIRTYDETNEESALSRLHFWQVAVSIAADKPLGVGLFNFEAAYDRYDTSGGAFGSQRSVHSSHFQVLAETGIVGFMAFEGLMLYAFWCAWRIRRRALTPNLDPDDARLFFTAANGLIAAFAAFFVGGAFVAMALNDLTWILLALLASLDLISARACEQAAGIPQPLAAVPLTWQPRSRAAI